MVETTSRSEAPLLRFGPVERRLHWVNAALFVVLMLTGAILYVGPLSALVGRRELIRNIHVWSGIVLPVPLLIALIGRRGARLRRDLGELNRFAPGEARWFRARTRGSVRLGKFNPGQKLNAAFIAGAGLVMLATGSIMKWFSLFPIDWRTGATFVHDWFALGIWVAVIGHVVFAFNDPVALGGMVRGSVSAAWARRERPRWYEAETRGRSPVAIESEADDSPR
ncbi:MAG: cytochrome b/b6 domain-containing protein [Acidimicrobiia bacterium]